MFRFSSPPSVYSSPRFFSAFIPQTPSPLQTSRNANLMPTTTPQHGIKSSPIFDSTSFFDENSPSALDSRSDLQTNFKARARSQSPQVHLARNIDTVRNHRKTAFLDKIKRNREHGKFDAREDQVLRMEFVRERREWERMLEERAPAVLHEEGFPGDEMDVDVNEADVPQERPPSPTEEQEMEELLSYLDESRGSPIMDNPNTRHSEAATETLWGEDEDDYDAIFNDLTGEAIQHSEIHEDLDSPDPTVSDQQQFHSTMDTS